MMNMLQQFKAARRVSTPLLAVQTPDPAATIRTIMGSLNGDVTPVLAWDIVQALHARNEPGQAVLDKLLGGGDPALTTGNPTEMLSLLKGLPGATRGKPGAVVFMHSANRFIQETSVAQAVWNLRDRFKMDQRTLVMLGPSFSFPTEITQDVTILDELLPDAAELVEIVQRCFKSAGKDNVDPQVQERAVDALLGLAAFPAEQVTAMSMTSQGLDLAGVWDRKRQMINQTPSLSVWRGGESFASIGGCQNVKEFLRRVMFGMERPRSIVFIDEIEKVLAGTGDTSGTSQAILGYLLTWMQDNNATGAIFIGPPGAAKSAVSKAAGNEAGIPTIALDLSGVKNSLVGETEGRMRNALKVIQAVSQNRAFFIATCNSIGVLPPELRRRFTYGTFFFDLPTAEEREACWNIYCKTYSVGGDIPDDEGWTGAEVRQCAMLARQLSCSLQEAAKYIVPVSVSASEQIDRLRQQASGRFLSASNPGIYRAAKPATVGSGEARAFA